jgi:trans-cinnamate 4-monooxygenase
MRIAPVGGIITRKTKQDLHLGDYMIPKNSRILGFAFSMAIDPELWDNPEEFRPERFLNEEKDIALRGGEMPKKRDYLKATFFGRGKRACVGYQLARKELFLQAAYYFWAFEFSASSPNQKLDLTMKGGLVGSAKFPVLVKA